jgi:DsbC/DsbD-like thiol-disulfide interchange protein
VFILKRIFAAVVLALGLSAPLEAQEPVRLEVLPGWRTAQGTHIAALQISLAPGWYTYWRSPGDVGFPPQFNWDRSRNVGSAKVHWPRPEIFESYGAHTVGYKTQVVIPVTLTPRRAGAMLVAGKIEIGVCRDICIPTSLTFRADLPADAAPDPVIQAALARVPVRVAGADQDGLGCSVAPIADGLRLTARLPLARLGEDEAAVMEYSDASVWVSATELSRDGGQLAVSAEFVDPGGQPFMLDRSQVTLTIFGSTAGVELVGCPARG